MLSLIAFAAFTVATVMLFSHVPTGFLPLEDKGALMANMQLPDGASLSRTEEVAGRATQMMLDIDGVQDVLTVPGYSLLSGAAPNSALMILIMDPWDQRTEFDKKWYSILRKANQKLATIASANTFAFPVPAITGLGTSGGVEAELQDLNGGTPEALAAATRSLVFAANQQPELTQAFSTFSANVPQLFLEVDRDKAQVLGIPISEIFATLQAQFGSSYINDFNLYGKVYRVVIQAESRFATRLTISTGCMCATPQTRWCHCRRWFRSGRFSVRCRSSATIFTRAHRLPRRLPQVTAQVRRSRRLSAPPPPHCPKATR